MNNYYYKGKNPGYYGYDNNYYDYYYNGNNYGYDQSQYNENQNNYFQAENKDSSKNNSNDNSNENPKLTLEKAILKSSYPKYTQDFIKIWILNNYSNKKNIKIYLTSINYENIFLINYCLSIKFNKIHYKIDLLIYFPILYPNYEPEFYISKKKKNEFLNRYYKDGKINEKDFKINIDYFVRFDAEKNNIEEIINKIKEEFNKQFPIYRDKSVNDGNNGLCGKCFLNKESLYEIIIENTNNNYIKNNYINDNKKEHNNLKTNDNIKDTLNNNIEKKKEFDDKSFLDFIRKQVKDILREKYLNYKEKFKTEKNQKELKKIDKSIKSKLNKVQNNSEIKNMQKNMELLKVIKEKLCSTEKVLIQENKKIQEYNKKSVFDKCNRYIKMKNEKVMEYIVKKKAIEDYLAYLKKGYERQIISFEDMVKQTRILSREIFYFEYLKNKEKSNKK
jgi:hypothetical protein